MTFTWSARFSREFTALPPSIKERAKKQLTLFSQNPSHPSLQVKKMEGWKNIWEGRVTRAYRFTFTLEDDRYVLRRIGSHNILDHP
jgi:mRNA-degrading endonuclease RelE of RelBE toxin-antitoxin system